MSESIASHQILSDECRKNRGSDEAVFEACQRLEQEALKVMDGWPIGCGMKLHFKLIVEVDRS